MVTVTISLPDKLKSFVDAQLEAKGFESPSAYVNSLLQEAQAKEEDARLEALLLEGQASLAIPVTEEFWQRLDGKVEDIISRRDASKKP